MMRGGAGLRLGEELDWGEGRSWIDSEESVGEGSSAPTST
jgi:hypothetical protein